MTDTMYASSNDDYLCGEFFGFLGRRIVFEESSDEEREFFRIGQPSWDASVEKSVEDLHALRKAAAAACEVIFRKERHPWKTLKTSDEKLMDMYHDWRRLPHPRGWEVRGAIHDLFSCASRRTSILTHHRGYEFAAKVDMGKITDMQKLFAMPNQEVRHRFFRNDPDYGGLSSETR